MLKLVFYTKETKLKVRLASPDDDFKTSFHWKDKIKFIISDSGEFTMAWTSLLPDLEPEYARALLELVGARYPVSEDFQTLQRECPDLLFAYDTDEWVFYGGSFNPWHQGHQSCLELLPENKVCFILPDRNPQKELADIHPVSKILEISSRAKLKPLQFLVPSFIFENKKNPTVEWIERIKKQFPEKKLSLLLGLDSFSQIQSWIRSDDLLKNLSTIYVVSRLENDEERNEAVERIARDQGPQIIFLGRHPFEHLSSTHIRKSQK